MLMTIARRVLRIDEPTRPHVQATAVSSEDRFRHVDLEPDFLPVLRRCQPQTMTSVERIYALYKAVQYLSAANVPGDIVECGVWRGGSMMCAALTLLATGNDQRRLVLFDTFTGMTTPGAEDIDFEGQRANDLMEQHEDVRCAATLDEVRDNMRSTGYPEHLINYVRGRVEDTVPAHAPPAIALLRLDTDWYSSTRHELEHLVPRMAKGGVLIVDDYGHWNGARRAVDEYFASSGVTILLNRVDYTGRIGIIP